jgi:predicted nucleic acid-binding protein
MGASYFLDSDVILDFLLKRVPFNITAKEIFALALNKNIEIYISSLAIANVHYLCQKSVGKIESLLLIEQLIKFCKILPVGEKEILEAIKSDFSDFEDAIQHQTAINHPEIKGIITRNIPDFRKSKLPIFTPESFLDLFI